jgi:hypothetical protein
MKLRLKQARHGYMLRDGPLGTELVANGRWTREAAEALTDPHVIGLVLSYTSGFSEPDLEFLEPWSIRRLVVLDRQRTDLSPVQRLADSVEDMTVLAGAGGSVDLSGFLRLSKLTADWEHVAATISGAENLRELTAWPYEGEADLEALAGNRHLTRVTLKDAKVLKSLSGTEDLEELQKLAILRAPFLDDVTALGLVEAPLGDLEFEDCMGIEELEHIGGLEELTWLGISNCGPLESLKPLESLGGLETLYAWGTTRISDNDLSPLMRLARLKQVRMRERRDYRPPLSEIKQILASRSA